MNEGFVKKSFELWSDGIPVGAHFGRGSDIKRKNNGPQILFRWKGVLDKLLK